MLPWMRVPNVKSTVAHVDRSRATDRRRSGPCRRRNSGCERWIGMALVELRRLVVLAPQQQVRARRGPGRCTQVRVALEVRRHERSAMRLTYGRDVHRDPGVAAQGRRALRDRQLVAVQEHRRAADDLDVAEAELVEVVLGELAADADRRAAVQHGRARSALTESSQARLAPDSYRSGRLEHRRRGPTPGCVSCSMTLRQPLEVLSRTTAGRRWRGDDVDVEALVDRASVVVGVDRSRSGVIDRVARVEELVAASRKIRLPLLSAIRFRLRASLGRDDLERVLGHRRRIRVMPSGYRRPGHGPSGRPRRQASARTAPSWLRMRAVAPQTDRPSTA